MKHISLIFILTFILQTSGDCKNCNKVTILTAQSQLGFQKQKKPKTNSPKATSSKLNNQKQEKTNLVPTQIQNASTITFGSTDQGLLITQTKSGNNILVIGSSNATGNSQHFTIASYDSTGTLNNSFGTKGIATTDFLFTLTGGSSRGSTDIPTCFVLQNNGALVVAGTSNALAQNDTTGTVTNFALARYTTSGALDKSFGTKGVVVTDVANKLFSYSGSTDKINSIFLQSNGNIIVAGTTNAAASGGINNNFVIARYRPNGSLDTSFGLNSTGIITINFSRILNINPTVKSTDILTSIQVLSNNKIIVCGYSNASDPNSDFAVAQLTANGQLDTSFNKTGVLVTNISSFVNAPTG